jgi:hypothetical protein
VNEIQSPFQIAQRVELRGAKQYLWIVLVSPPPIEDIDSGLITAELAEVTLVPVRTISQTQFLFDTLRDALHTPDDDIVVVLIGEWSEDDWRRFDINRSALERTGAILLWITTAQLVGFATAAPNIRSFVGVSIFYIGADGGAMSEPVRARRVRELEEHYQMKSEEMLLAAQRGEFFREPQALEWLILLGRGDLIQ